LPFPSTGNPSVFRTSPGFTIWTKHRDLENGTDYIAHLATLSL
jgi:hypothetical protein